MDTSPHYDLHLLAPGVWAAIAKLGGAAISNAGLVDLGDRTLIFDTFLTPQAAQDLLDDSLRLTGRKPAIVVNSHYHNDHIWGNQVFLPSAQIYASSATRKLITSAGMDEYREYKEITPARLAALREELPPDASREKQQERQLWLAYYQGLQEAFPTLRVCLPEITFEHDLAFHGKHQTAVLQAVSDCHTGSDTYLYLPEQGIIFLSDLLFIGMHPYLPDGDPFRLRVVLKEIAQLGATVLVPGHGPVGTAQDLEQVIAYIDHCMDVGQRLALGGLTPSEIDATLPAAYLNWQLPGFYQANLAFFKEHFAEKA